MVNRKEDMMGKRGMKGDGEEEGRDMEGKRDTRRERKENIREIWIRDGEEWRENGAEMNKRLKRGMKKDRKREETRTKGGQEKERVLRREERDKKK